jgi:hypothetical protein
MTGQVLSPNGGMVIKNSQAVTITIIKNMRCSFYINLNGLRTTSIFIFKIRKPSEKGIKVFCE